MIKLNGLAYKIYSTRNYPPSILIVSNGSPWVRTLKRTLKNKGCQVRQVASTPCNIDVAHQKYFDLVVVDIEGSATPDFEICKKFKADPELANVHMIVLTTPDHSKKAMTEFNISPPVSYITKDTGTEVKLFRIIEHVHYMTYRYMGYIN